MKNVLVMTLIVGLFLVGLPAEQAQAEEPKRGAVVLSIIMPGTGEWLNRDFEGSFPMVECILGNLCCLFTLSSTLDAAAGDSSEKIRFDFWSKPVAEQTGSMAGAKDGLK